MLQRNRRATEDHIPAVADRAGEGGFTLRIAGPDASVFARPAASGYRNQGRAAPGIGLMALKFLTRLLVLAALGYVGYALYRAAPQLLALDIGASRLLLAAAAATVMSAGVVLALGLAWSQITGGGSPAVWVVCRTAVAKYLPGNVLQYVGRQFYAGALGVPQKRLALATGAEVAFSVSAAAAIATLADWRFAFLAAAPLAILLVPKLRPALKAYPACFAAIALNTASFIVPAVIFGVGDWASLIPAYAIAFVAGLVTPGAPGGLGVREAALIAITGNAPVIIAAALVQRFGNILGELLCFGLTLLWSGPSSDRSTAGTPTADGMSGP